MVQCSKVVTGHRYDIGLLKAEVFLLFRWTIKTVFLKLLLSHIQPFCTEVADWPYWEQAPAPLVVALGGAAASRPEVTWLSHLPAAEQPSPPVHPGRRSESAILLMGYFVKFHFSGTALLLSDSVGAMQSCSANYVAQKMLNTVLINIFIKQVN